VKGLYICMKKMNLFLVGVVLLLSFAGIACAEVGNESNGTLLNGSDENQTGEVLLEENQSEIVIVSFENDTIVFNESNESNGTLLNGSDENQTGEVLLDENQTGEIEDLVVEDVVVGDLIAGEKDSPFDAARSYVARGIGKVNEVHENLFLVIVIVVVLLLLLVYSVFYDTSSADACFAKAAGLHRRAERAHVDGNYEKAKKLYGKSYSLREKGEGLSGRADDSAI